MGRLNPRTSRVDTDELAAAIGASSRPLTGPDDLSGLVKRVADADCVLLGEASHGTSEFYRWRASMTAELLREHDFDFVAVEGGWPVCYEANRYVKGAGDNGTARDALDAFDRWPTWMWANWEVAGFLDWLADHNAGRPEDDRAGFYGLDVYSLHESMTAVVDYLEDVDPGAADHARAAYRCFDPFGEDGQAYARALRMVPNSCEDEVVEVLGELQRNREAYERLDDDYFDAEQNALVAEHAEAYYRSMVSHHDDSWNVRDRHMVETFERLRDHHGPDSKAVVWAHNTHVGDARATDMVDRGRINVGQLLRERDDADGVAVVGFGTHRGSVIAADAWGAGTERMAVPRAKSGSVEAAFHRAGGDRLLYAADVPTGSPLGQRLGHRAIGVVYHPEREAGNYVPTVLPDRYDAFVHVDETTALHPIEQHTQRRGVPDLYPFGV